MGMRDQGVLLKTKGVLMDDSSQDQDTDKGPLPQGWERKVEHKTGRPYFEK